MKILIFNWQDGMNPDAGGAEVHMHEIFSRVAAMGHDVTLFCSSFPNAATDERVRDIRVIRKGGRYFFNFLVPWCYLMRFRHEGYDVVIDNMNKIPFFTMLYVRRPLAFIIHHLFDKSIFVEAALPVALYVYLMERAAVSLLRRRHVPVFTVSPSTRQELLEKGLSADQISIVHNCVDHRTHRPDPDALSRTPLIGYFGRLKKYKSVEHLLESFAVVIRTFPDLRLVIVGEGDHRPSLEAYCRRLGLGESVRFTGFVPEEEKVRLLRQVWFVVNPSSKEGWGLTVIEANACGAMVVGSNVPGLRDAIKNGETGVLYEYGDVTRLAGIMTDLLRDRERRQRLAAAASAWSLTFDWDRVAEKTVSLLESVRSGQF